jgi:mRNA-degrading endonuclease RelE of RelBE toxin-antitoxin system
VRVERACLELANDPERGKPLQLTPKGLRSWRTGDFRIVYRIVAERVEVILVAPGHRREIYAVVERLLRER